MEKLPQWPFSILSLLVLYYSPGFIDLSIIPYLPIILKSPFTAYAGHCKNFMFNAYRNGAKAVAGFVVQPMLDVL